MKRVRAGVGRNRERTGGSFAHRGRIAPRGKLHGAHSLHRQHGLQLAGNRVGDVEAVQRIKHLVGRRTVEMGRAGGVFQHARHQSDGVQQAVAVGIGNVVHLGAGELFPVASLSDVHRGRPLIHVHRLEHLPDLGNCEGGFRGVLGGMHRLIVQRVVARAFHSHQVIAGRGQRNGKNAGGIRACLPGAGGWHRGQSNRDQGAAHRGFVFIHHAPRPGQFRGIERRHRQPEYSRQTH